MRYAIVQDGVVLNLTRWDGVTEWSPPEGCIAVEAPPEVTVGWTYDAISGLFAAPPDGA